MRGALGHIAGQGHLQKLSVIVLVLRNGHSSQKISRPFDMVCAANCAAILGNPFIIGICKCETIKAGISEGSARA